MLHPNRNKTLISAAVASALALLAAPAFAQETAAPAAEGIQEVMVTATRYSTSLLKTPVAVSALTQEDLTRQGAVNIKALSGEIPNLQLGGAVDGSSGVQIAIRGVSNSDFTEIGNPAVGLHVAGIYSPRPQGALALLFDLDRLEVLRGPQGTLFGRNSTGGSINIIPNKPVIGSKEGNAELDVGNYNHRQLSVVQNIPVNERMALRFTASGTQRDGWINQTQDRYDVNMPSKGFVADGIPDTDQRLNRKVGKGDYYTNRDQWAARLSGLWKITDNLQWLVSFENFQNNDAGDLAIKDCEQAAGTPYACTGGKYDVAINVPGVTDMSIRTLRSNLVWNVNAQTDVEYSYAHAIQRRFQQQDSDAGYQRIEADVNATAAAGGSRWPVRDNATYTMGSKFLSDVHELQLRQNFGALRYVAGVFYMKEKNSLDYGQDFMANDSDGYPYANFYHQPKRISESKAVFAQADWQFVPKWTFTAGVRASRDSRSDQNGQFWESYGTDYFNGLLVPGAPGTPGYTGINSGMLLPGMGAYYGSSAFPTASTISDHADSWSKTTGRLGLTWQVDNRNMLYTSLSTGYKAGGFNDRFNLCGNDVNPATGVAYNCATGPAGPQYSFLPYKPETVTNLELGYKGKLLDDRLTLSLTAFYSRYKDMQVTGQHTVGRTERVCEADNPGCDAVISWWSTQNVGKANIKGLELEGQYRPWRDARITYSAALLSAKVADYPTYSDDIGCAARLAQGVTPCPDYYSGTDPSLAQLRPYDVTGNTLPYAPRRTMNLSFSQDFTLPNGWSLTPWIQARWQDKVYFSLRNLDEAHLTDTQAAYAQVDASLRLNSASGSRFPWHVELYVRNLDDKRARTWAGAGGPDQTFTVAAYNDPRMFGLRVGTEW
ncbi:iron complex outermembrane receptor protein [Pseudoduganella lurida]|uniref:Iron complex outermembrane receptor protein n=1 Tax=Pseudoduganella lurida TaxID=1036180 RepID=A0A562RMI6_9BURK|nr:TonB-dependent receptor [Pseudoduganella lurida]TWI69824.1 iron complex outermembrane receptor protein [Pseudoduganella lurida]